MSDEADSGGSSPEPEIPTEQVSEIQVTIGEHSKFIADNFDKLYAEIELLKDALEATEIKLQVEMDAKMKAVQDMLLLRIEALEARTAGQSERIAEQQSLSKLLGKQLEELQSHVGVLFFRFH